MIEINLIPEKLKKARRMQMVYAGGIGIGVLIVGILLGLIWMQMQKISKIEKEIKSIDAESASLRDRIDEVRKFNAMEAVFNKKKKIIISLMESQVMLAKLLDRIGEIILPDMWLTAIEQEKEMEQGIEVILEGMAYSKPIIADFIKRFERSPGIMGLSAVEIEEMEDEKLGMKAVKFKISFVYQTQKKEG